MKIDPGFPGHWKTRQLYNTLGAAAVVGLIRLWGHAQISREWEGLELTPKKLKAICDWPGDEQDLWAAFIDPDCSWLDSNIDGTFSIHGFEEHQAQVIALWKNGKKGGRPAKPKTAAPLSLPLPHTLTPLGFHAVDAIEPNGNHLVSDMKPPASKAAENSPLMIRVGSFFNRQPSTRWDAKERKALKALEPIEEEDLKLLERWFQQIQEPGEEIYRRKKLITLLNNWNGEVDTANSYFADKRTLNGHAR